MISDGASEYSDATFETSDGPFETSDVAFEYSFVTVADAFHAPAFASGAAGTRRPQGRFGLARRRFAGLGEMARFRIFYIDQNGYRRR